MNSIILRHVTLYSLVEMYQISVRCTTSILRTGQYSYCLFGLFFDSEERSSTFLRNIGKFPLHCIISKRWCCSTLITCHGNSDTWQAGVRRTQTNLTGVRKTWRKGIQTLKHVTFGVRSGIKDTKHVIVFSRLLFPMRFMPNAWNMVDKMARRVWMLANKTVVPNYKTRNLNSSSRLGRPTRKKGYDVLSI
jgi:hypothetical protein